VDIAVAGQLSDDHSAPPVRVATWFDLASLTKPITALAAARLVRAARLDWKTPLAALLPEVRDTPSATIPIELFLAHRAGLDAHGALYRDFAVGRLGGRENALLEAACSRYAGAVGTPPEHGFPPLYSDLGYLLAGEAIARVAGAPLDAALEELVIAPLGAAIGSARQLRGRDAHFDCDVAATEIAAWRGGTIRGAVHDENAWFWAGEGSAGHAGLFGTAAGVLTVGTAVVDAVQGRRPEFLTREQILPLVCPRPGGTLRAGFDGKSEQGSSAGTKFGKNIVGHLGFTGTSLWCDVEAEMVGVVLTNRVHPSRDNDMIRKMRPFAYDAIATWAEQRRS
jgi:CubicO group peptidase (beta-lactamase class C family)